MIERTFPPIADAPVAIVVVCTAVGCGLSFVFQTLIGIASSWVLAVRGVRVEDLLFAMSELDFLNVLSVIANVASTCAAGALAAWLNAERRYAHALLSGLLMTAFVAIQFLVPYEHMAPAWTKLAVLVVPIPSTLVGAWLASEGRGFWV